MECKHPPHRLYSWWVSDALGEGLSVMCCECGECLRSPGEEREREFLESLKRD